MEVGDTDETSFCLWVPLQKDKETIEWVLANKVEEDLDKGMYVVETISKPTTRFHVEKSSTCELDPSHLLDLDNLCTMNNLHEAPLLEMLGRRFLKDSIYTNTSDVLISCNPYKVIPGLYDSPLEYLNLSVSTL